MIIDFLRRIFGMKKDAPADRILVDREGVAYLPQGRPVQLKAPLTH